MSGIGFFLLFYSVELVVVWVVRGVQLFLESICEWGWVGRFMLAEFESMGWTSSSGGESAVLTGRQDVRRASSLKRAANDALNLSILFLCFGLQLIIPRLFLYLVVWCRF